MSKDQLTEALEKKVKSRSSAETLQRIKKLDKKIRQRSRDAIAAERLAEIDKIDFSKGVRRSQLGYTPETYKKDVTLIKRKKMFWLWLKISAVLLFFLYISYLIYYYGYATKEEEIVIGPEDVPIPLEDQQQAEFYFEGRWLPLRYCYSQLSLGANFQSEKGAKLAIDIFGDKAVIYDNETKANFVARPDIFTGFPGQEQLQGYSLRSREFLQIGDVAEFDVTWLDEEVFQLSFSNNQNKFAIYSGSPECISLAFVSDENQALYPEQFRQGNLRLVPPEPEEKEVESWDFAQWSFVFIAIALSLFIAYYAFRNTSRPDFWKLVIAMGLVWSYTMLGIKLSEGWRWDFSGVILFICLLVFNVAVSYYPAKLITTFARLES